ncbi:MAG: hypothetical protein IPP64_03175 [Bacteroidetes bacterium]|nr:hypothetical protein [Bacteroidota bacterium]
MKSILTNTNMYKKTALFTFAALAAFAISSCNKPEGEGGQATIKGKIWVENYSTLNNMADTYTFKGEFAGADKDVYIIYGDDVSYGNKVKSSPDGVFEFKYLRKGDYKIYVQSKDTTRASFFYGSGIKTVDVSVTIGNKKETVDAGTLTILN